MRQKKVPARKCRQLKGALFLSDIFVACVAGGFGGRESQAKTSGGAAGEMGREQRQSRRSRVNERLCREEPPAPIPVIFVCRPQNLHILQPVDIQLTQPIRWQMVK